MICGTVYDNKGRYVRAATEAETIEAIRARHEDLTYWLGDFGTEGVVLDGSIEPTEAGWAELARRGLRRANQREFEHLALLLLSP